MVGDSHIARERHKLFGDLISILVRGVANAPVDRVYDVRREHLLDG